MAYACICHFFVVILYPILMASKPMHLNMANSPQLKVVKFDHFRKNNYGQTERNNC